MRKSIIIGVLLTLLSVSTFSSLVILPAKAVDTIYIRADGSIDPSTAPIQRNGNVYTLTGNLISDANGIVVERDNIVVDDSSFTVAEVTVTAWSSGIHLHGRSNVTVQNTNIKNFFFGIWLNSSSNNSINGNTAADNNGAGIYLDYSSNSTISGNNVASNFEGIHLGDSSYNNVSGNNIRINEDFGIRLDSSPNNTISGNTFFDNGLLIVFSSDNVVVGNLVNGKPLVYLEEVTDYAARALVH